MTLERSRREFLLETLKATSVLALGPSLLRARCCSSRARPAPRSQEALSPNARRLYFSSQRALGNNRGITYEISGPF